LTTVSGEPVAGADATRARTSLRRLRLSVLLVSLPFGMLTLGLPLVAREMGASSLMIGGLFAISALVIVAVQPVVGLGLDRYGRRAFLIAGLLGYALSNAIFGLASGIAGLFLAQLAQGIGSGLVWLAALAIVSDLASVDSRGREYGGVEETSFRGMLIGTVAGFAVLRLLGRDVLGGASPIVSWRVLFLGFTAAALLAAVIVWQGIPESLHRSPDRPRQAPVALGGQPTKSSARWRLSRQLSVVLGIVLLTASAFEIISPILIKYLNDHISSNLLLVALAFLPAALVGATLPSRLGGVSDRIGRRPPMIGALLIGCLAALAIPFAQSLWPLALLWAVEAAAFAAATPAEEALVVDLAGGERLGVALGFYTAAAGLGGVIGPLLGGWLFDHFAVISVFGSAALMMLLGALLILLAVREPLRRKRLDAAS
jgi:MFS transporter, DHA1 family, multidrug resistance protein